MCLRARPLPAGSASATAGSVAARGMAAAWLEPSRLAGWSCRVMEEWEARIKDLALISKLAAQLYTYLGIGAPGSPAGEPCTLNPDGPPTPLPAPPAASVRAAGIAGHAAHASLCCGTPGRRCWTCWYLPCIASLTCTVPYRTPHAPTPSRLALVRLLLAPRPLLHPAAARLPPDGRLLLPQPPPAALGALRPAGGPSGRCGREAGRCLVGRCMP